MNIYYMNTNITQSDFPIVVWNDLIPRSVGAVWCPAGEYEHHTGRWGEPEGMNLGPDVGLASNNNTDRDRRDTFPVLLSDVMDKDEHL
jgi:hypothetical protein